MSGNIRSNVFLAMIDEILRLQNCFEDLFGELSEASGMSTLQKLVLFAVFEAPVPPTVPQIGRDLGHPRQVIQRIVNELVDADILEKMPNPHHKRAMLLVPTDKAQAMKRQAEDRALETAEAFLGEFSAPRCAGLTGELKALREALEAYVKRRGLPLRSTGDAGLPAGSTFALLERLG
ncbi:MarR family winged helix-turn-helix transcriptional regulator [Novosphingobium mangrovi (ex Huang et al. 2023)]|uniref:MarR family transcriptional regulator n=1 Tax=Novosphingobium mangrovi (ex Huang et al. 2023) TaxID=2976432 RepID=A0ABT2I3F1_9SPHN|nr:MarR family transcriptional regulator [Novosphingobium mangrovi (ex Huang et al. 2023)]MCT2399335.1 MarR family transcriptional regulator [Novosphingobium mangrovi (ex Huang et al. 2023)]